MGWTYLERDVFFAEADFEFLSTCRVLLGPLGVVFAQDLALFHNAPQLLDHQRADPHYKSPQTTRNRIEQGQQELKERDEGERRVVRVSLSLRMRLSLR